MNKVVTPRGEILRKDMFSAMAATSHAMAGESLSADQLNVVVGTEDEPFYSADGDTPLITADRHIYWCKNNFDAQVFESGDELLLYAKDALAGKYYFDSLTRQGADKYKISAVTIIGRLINNRHYGGIYTNALAADVYADVLAGIDYELDPDVAEATVTGYLPIASRRDNLQQLLMVTGATVSLNADGMLRISAMSPEVAGVFDASRCYMGGSVENSTPVAGVKLTEHNYFESGEAVVLFSDGVDGEEFIEFSEPYHDLVIDGGEILESGANFARISAKGAVLLTGKPYTHVTRQVTAGVTNGGITDTVSTVSSCYLANPQIAQALADRFYAFLKCSQTIRQDVIAGTERAGDVVSVMNPYTGQMLEATIKRYDMTMSGVNKATAEFLVGYVPQGVLSGFTQYALLTGSGAWEVPEGVSKIRVILVGAGGGGGGGEDGEDGEAGSWSNGDDGGTARAGRGGSGGKGGKAGESGKVFELSLNVTPGQQFDYVCGGKGVGGAVGGNEGTPGTPTIFGVYSSDFGRQYPYGYREAKTGLTLAAAGAEGFDGGDGGDATATFASNTNTPYGEDGESVNEFAGGAGSPSVDYGIGTDGRDRYYYTGSGGGGAANGKKGSAAKTSYSKYSGFSCYGGDGATPPAGADAENYGEGGAAGNGGGGGGGGGVYRWRNVNSGVSPAYRSVKAGVAGKGTEGGDGGPGCIIVYY